MGAFTVEFTKTVIVEAEDIDAAVEQAQVKAKGGEESVYVDGNWYC